MHFLLKKAQEGQEKRKQNKQAKKTKVPSAKEKRETTFFPPSHTRRPVPGLKSLGRGKSKGVE